MRGKIKVLIISTMIRWIILSFYIIMAFIFYVDDYYLSMVLMLFGAFIWTKEFREIVLWKWDFRRVVISRIILSILLILMAFLATDTSSMTQPQFYILETAGNFSALR